MTPEAYRILFGEDQPAEDASTGAIPAASEEPEVIIDLTTEAHNPPPRFTVQSDAVSLDPVDPRPLWRRKRVQFPVAILVMISLLSIDNADDDPRRRSPDDAPAVSNGQP